MKTKPKIVFYAGDEIWNKLKVYAIKNKIPNLNTAITQLIEEKLGGKK